MKDMQTIHEVARDGPYLRIVLPDAVPADWGALLRQVEFECEEPLTRATIVLRHPRSAEEATQVRRVMKRLVGSGADVSFVWRDGAPWDGLRRSVETPHRCW